MKLPTGKSLSAVGKNPLRPLAFAALLLAGCASLDGPSGSAGYSSQAPWGAPILPEATRSGDGAISRSSIDGTLNKPKWSPDQKPREKAAEERPGLATGFGESIASPWNRQSFVRSSPKPLGTSVVYYNDREGIDAMAGWKSKASPMQTAAGEVIEWGIKGSFGFLPTYSSWHRGGRRFVAGKKEANYSIVLKNRCKSRLEVVLSVDGLDVIDGKPASFVKRGYVIAAGETLEVKGWRTGPDSVARFKFSSVAGSYANLARGEHRNVGVIGMAVFGEKGVDPWTWMPSEIKTRQDASPFSRPPGS